MKKTVLSLASFALVSMSSMGAFAQSTLGPLAVAGCNPRPQGILSSVYAAVMGFFGF